MPRWRSQRVAAIGLLAIVVLSLAFAGVLGYYGVAAGAPGQYTVDGTVYAETSVGGERPLSDASVTIQEEGGRTGTTATNLGGNFDFAAVPAGGITLKVLAAEYSPATVSTFVSPVYDAGTTGLAIVLVPEGTGNSTNATLTPFPDLESFLASIGTGVVLLGLVAAIALVTGILTLRQDRPALGVVGGGAGLAVPFALYLLALGSAFPILIATTTVLAIFGGFTLALRAVEIGRTAPPPDEA